MHGQQTQAPAASAAADAKEPLPSGVEERVEVALAEFKILVTDRRGQAITDLTRDEIRVFERGVEQRLAFVEQATSESFTASLEETGAAPATVYDTSGDSISSIRDLVMPAKPFRRVVFAFDVRNSKIRDREEWQQAAQIWLDTEMRATDRVGIVTFRTGYPDWLVEYTSDRELLRNTLKSISITGGTGDRDRRRDMSRLIDDIRSACVDIKGQNRNPRNQRQADNRSSSANEEVCSFNISVGYAQEWQRDGLETVNTLKTLVGQLAAIPGRKLVMLFSHGFVPDAGEVATAAMMSIFGSDRISVSRTTWDFDRGIQRDVNDLFRIARAGDVSFFTLDSRSSNSGSFGGQLEQAQSMSYQSMGMNPWNEMQEVTRGSLESLALETGGRAFRGPKDLSDKVRTAANAYFGYYSIGYYRSDPSSPSGSVRVEVDRKRLRVDYPDRPELWPHRAVKLPLEIAIGEPLLMPDGTQALPIALAVPFDQMPLRRSGMTYGTQLGVFIQALRPDGVVQRERLDLAEISLDSEEKQAAKNRLYQHRTNITLPTGSYRLRVRLSDDRLEAVGEKTIDLTLLDGAVRGGLTEPVPVPAVPAGDAPTGS